MLFEYVRPQSIYPIIAGPPWALLSILATLAAVIVEGRRPRIPTPLAATLVFFTVVMIASRITAIYPDAATAELKLFGNWLLLVVLISCVVDNERKWFLFLMAFLLFSLKMSQHGFISWIGRGFAFTSWGVTGAPGWFQNSGEFALQMGIFVSLAVSTYFALRAYMPRWLRAAWFFLPISAIGSIIASSSRGGLLALIVIAVMSVLRTRYRVRALVSLAVGLPVLWITVPPEFKLRFTTAGTDATSQARLRFWSNGMEMARMYPALGVGPGNWLPYYRDNYIVPGDSLNRFDERGQLMIQPAHNSFVEVVSQLGYTGLFAFVSVILAVFVVNWRTRRLVTGLGPSGDLIRLTSSSLDDGVVVFCVAGFFMSVAMYPFLWVQVALSAAAHTAARNLARRSVSTNHRGRDDRHRNRRGMYRHSGQNMTGQRVDSKLHGLTQESAPLNNTMYPQ